MMNYNITGSDLTPNIQIKLKPKNLYDSLRNYFFIFYLLDREVIQNINFLIHHI